MTFISKVFKYAYIWGLILLVLGICVRKTSYLTRYDTNLAINVAWDVQVILILASLAIYEIITLVKGLRDEDKGWRVYSWIRFGLMMGLYTFFAWIDLDFSHISQLLARLTP